MWGLLKHPFILWLIVIAELLSILDILRFRLKVI